MTTFWPWGVGLLRPLDPPLLLFEWLRLLNTKQKKRQSGIILLPPAYAVRWKVIFSLCPPSGGGGTPPCPAGGGGGYPTLASQGGSAPWPAGEGCTPPWLGYYPPGQDGVPPWQECDTPPSQDGVPPWPGAAQRVHAMRWAACLLRSRRKTFSLYLFWFFSWFLKIPLGNQVPRFIVLRSSSITEKNKTFLFIIIVSVIVMCNKSETNKE